jgi:hypothetical protein
MNLMDGTNSSACLILLACRTRSDKTFILTFSLGGFSKDPMRSLLIIAVIASVLLVGGFLSFAFMDVDVPQKDEVVQIPVPSVTPAPEVAAEPAPTPSTLTSDTPSVPPAVPAAPEATAPATAAPATDE